MNTAFSLVACGLLASLAAQHRDPVLLTYLRPTPKGHVEECRFTLSESKEGWSISSVTTRGDTRMRVSARYDAGDRLLGAEAVLTKGEKPAKAEVVVDKSKTIVKRAGMPDQSFDVAPGAIVTSAPDWSDIFLLCRKHSAKKGGTQTFAGLWIHPEQAAQSIPFSIEKIGEDVVELAGQKRSLSRFKIRIRGPQPYTAWADEHGMLVKIQQGGIVCQGWEKAAAILEP